MILRQKDVQQFMWELQEHGLPGQVGEFIRHELEYIGAQIAEEVAIGELQHSQVVVHAEALDEELTAHHDQPPDEMR